jgi:TfoX/Sxy family transcriptional regulator of competence genes
MAYNEQLAARIRDYLTALRLPVEEKRMMGGLCFMVRDKMCVGVTDDRLMVRLDPETMSEALARRGCTPMDFTGRALRSFVFVSPEGWTAKKDFDGWLTRALEFNPRAKSSKKRAKKPSPAQAASEATGARRKE